jgi:hypothetical protein
MILTLSFSLKPFFVALARFANDSTGQESDTMPDVV